jgi:hypothetical protein
MDHIETGTEDRIQYNSVCERNKIFFCCYQLNKTYWICRLWRFHFHFKKGVDAKYIFTVHIVYFSSHLDALFICRYEAIKNEFISSKINIPAHINNTYIFISDLFSFFLSFFRYVFIGSSFCINCIKCLSAR